MSTGVETLSSSNQLVLEDEECPLCYLKMEPEDLTFHPCTCTFKICRFCWYRLFLDENPVCPMCRTVYSKARAMSQLGPASVIAQIENLRVSPEKGGVAFEIIRTSAYFDPNLDIPTEMFSSRTKLIELLASRDLIQVRNGDYTRMRTKEPIVTAVLRSADPGKVMVLAMRSLWNGLVLDRGGRGVDEETRVNRRGRIKTYLTHGLCLWDHIVKLEDKGLMSSPFFSTLCNRCQQLGLCHEIFQIIQKTLPVVQRVFGVVSIQTIKVQADKAKTLSRLQRYDEAMGILSELLEPSQRHLGYLHLVTLTIRSEMGTILTAQGKLEAALILSTEMCRLHSETLGPHHPGTISAYLNQGNLLCQMSRYAEALKVFRSSYDAERRVFGASSLVTLSAQFWIGYVLCKQGHVEEALPIFGDVYEKHQNRQYPDQALILKSAAAIAQALNQLGQYTEAVRICKEQIERLQDSHVPNDEELIAEIVTYLVKVRLEQAKGLLGLKMKTEAEVTLIFVLHIYRNLGKGQGDETKEAAALLERCRLLP